MDTNTLKAILEGEGFIEQPSPPGLFHRKRDDYAAVDIVKLAQLSTGKVYFKATIWGAADDLAALVAGMPKAKGGATDGEQG